MRYLTALSIAILVAPSMVIGQTHPEDTLPVDRIPPAVHGAWAEALLLTNRSVEVVLEPGSGRMVELGLGSASNVLHATQDTGGEGLSVNPPGEVTWSAHAWLTADGARHARVRGLPAGSGTVAVTREFAVDEATTNLTVRQEIEGDGDARGEVVLHHTLRLVRPERIVLPTDPDSAFGDGYTLLAAGNGQHVLNRCEGAVVLDCAFGGRYTLGTDSRQGWWAAARGGQLILLRVTEGATAATFSESGCRLRVVNDLPAGYAELHLAGPGPEGNTLEISRHPLPPDLGPSELAAFSRKLAREDAAMESGP